MSGGYGRSWIPAVIGNSENGRTVLYREQLANQVFKSYQPHRDRGKMRAKSEELKRIAEHLLHCDKQLTCRDEVEINKDSLEQLILACLRLHIQITVTAEKQREELGREISYAGMECVGG